MASKEYAYKSIIHHPKGSYELHEKEMRIPKIMKDDHGWELITGMKYYREKDVLEYNTSMCKLQSDTTNY